MVKQKKTIYEVPWNFLVGYREDIFGEKMNVEGIEKG